MSFRGGRGSRSRGRFRGRSRDRSPIRERTRQRVARSRSPRRSPPGRERFDARRPSRPESSRERIRFSPNEEKRRPRSPEEQTFRNRISPPPPRFEEDHRPRFDPVQELQFDMQFERNVFEKRENELRPTEIIERRAEIVERRLEVPERKFEFNRNFQEESHWRDEPKPQESMRFSPINFDSKDPQDKPDPWTDSIQSQSLPTFGQAKGSSLIPEFDPDNTNLTSRTWIKLIEKIGTEKKWWPEDKKFNFSSKIRGTARDWFLTGDKILEPWSHVKKQFLSAFPSDMDYYSSLEKMIKREKKPKEDISAYFNYKIVLLNNCKITGRKAVSCLIGGLGDDAAEIKDEAIDRNFATPEELYEFLINKSMDDATLSKKGRKCFVCGSAGHIKAQCHHLKKLMNVPEPDNPSFKEVSINGHPVKAIFDDEFPHITIKENEIDRLNIKYRKQISIIDGKDRGKLTALGQATVRLHVDAIMATVDVYVVKDQAQSARVILGRAMRRYAHYMEDKSGVHFSPLEKAIEENRRETVSRRRSSSPNRIVKDGRAQHSPDRHPPSPGRTFKESHPFLSKFYGNPYM